MESVKGSNEQVPPRERLRLTRGLLGELELLDFPLDLVAPDRESAAAGDDAGDYLVTGGGLRIVLKLHWATLEPNAHPSSDDGVLAAAQSLLQAVPDVDAIVVVLPPAPYRAVVVDAFAAGAAVEVPSGSSRSLPKGDVFPSVREALRQLVAPPDVDWSGLPPRPLVTSVASLAERARIREFADAELADVQAAGARAHGDAKREAWQGLTSADAAWAADRVHNAVKDAKSVGTFADSLDIALREGRS